MFVQGVVAGQHEWCVHGQFILGMATDGKPVLHLSSEFVNLQGIEVLFQRHSFTICQLPCLFKDMSKQRFVVNGDSLAILKPAECKRKLDHFCGQALLGIKQECCRQIHEGCGSSGT